MKVRLALLAILLVPCWVIAYRFNVDLHVLHTVASWIQVDWERIYGDTGASGRFFYGPVTVLFLYPLHFMNYGTAYWFYSVVQTLCYAVLWWGLYKATPNLWPKNRKDKKNFFAWTLLFIFSINPIHNNFQSGNVQLQLIALLILAEHLEAFGGGMIAAIPILVKVFPGLLIPYYMMTKPKKFFFGMAAGTAVLHLGVVALGDLNTLGILYKGFVTNLTTYGNENSLLKIPDLLSLPSMFARLGVEKMTVAVSGLLYTVGLGILFKYRKNVDSGVGFALVLTIVTLINPSTRVHYFVFYVPLFSYLCNYAAKEKKTGIWAETISVLLLLAFTVEGIVGKTFNDTLEFWSVPTFGVVLLILISLLRFGRLYAKEC